MEGFGDIKPIWQLQKWKWSTFLENVEREGNGRPVSADAQLERISDPLCEARELHQLAFLFP